MADKFKRRRGSRGRLARQIIRFIKKEVAVEIRRQRESENAIWASCFADGEAAKPQKQRDRVMRLASAKAALHLISNTDRSDRQGGRQIEHPLSNKPQDQG